MLKKSLILLIISIFLLPLGIVAQDMDASTIGADDSMSDVQEYILDTFESEGHWNATISNDVGYTIVKYIEGGASEKSVEKKDQDDNTEITDELVLGVRVDFLKRAWYSIFVKPDAPIEIRGVAKVFSFYAIGRMYDHRINLLFENYRGKFLRIPVGRMNFYGWQKMEVAIPPTVDQEDPNYPARGGLKFLGFQIDLSPMQIRGDYYVYFDDLRVQTDISAESYALPDDIDDIW